MNQRNFLWMALLALISLLFVDGVWAHGGGTPRVVNQPIGDYAVSVWTSPEPLEAGTIHLTVGLAQPDPNNASTNIAVLEQTVRLTLTPADGSSAALTAIATHDNATNKLFYETDVEVPAQGTWQVELHVAEANATTAFDLNIEPKSITRSVLMGVGAVAIIGVVLWLSRTKES